MKAPRGTEWFCAYCRTLAEESGACGRCGTAYMLIDKDSIERDERGRIVDVQAATTRR